MSLSSQEKNLACLYHSGSRADTAAQIREALPCLNEPDTLAAAHGALEKLEAMSEMEFSLTFREVML
uniref:Uncharacterized protein n=1 Tax=termite gut metagenome TaxID=433724 RepID=S0DD95_9ZZZZ